MAWLALLLYGLLIAPVRAWLIFRWQDGRAEGASGLSLWGVRVQARADLFRDEKGAVCARILFLGRERTLRPRLSPKGFQMLRGGGGASFLPLLGRVRVFADIRVGGRDAAKTAVLTGLLQIFGSLLPNALVRCAPAFQGRTSVLVRCIGAARLGTIIAVCLRALAKRLFAGKKEEKAWIVPSGT